MRPPDSTAKRSSDASRDLRAFAPLILVAISLPGFSAAVRQPPHAAAPPVAQSKPSPVEAGKPFQQDIPTAAFKFEMVPVPAGPDGEIPAFWMSKNEVTWEAFDTFIYRLDEEKGAPPLPDGTPDAVTRPSKPYLPPDRGFGHEGFAAISMSYATATEFCKWLTARSGRHYRLPTEKEWEYACRAGATTRYSFGDDPGKLSDYAWYKDDAADAPHAVGSKKPNAWGLCDMHGNVAEWCSPAADGGKPAVRGGSYRDDADALTCASRVESSPTWNASDPQIPKSKWWLADAPFIGFRVVCDNPNGPAAPPARPKAKPAPATPTP